MRSSTTKTPSSRLVKSARKPRPISGDIPADPVKKAYVFRLFVSGNAEKSSRAIANIKRICEENFPNCYQLDVVDVYQQPQLASKEQIIAVPTLVKKSPGPLKKFIGDLSDHKKFVSKLH